MTGPLWFRAHLTALLSVAALFGMLLSPGAALIAAPPEPDLQDPASSPAPGKREELAWTQSANTPADLREIQFILVVDGARSALEQVSCDQQPHVPVFDCRAPLPSLHDGSHEIQVVASFRTGRGRSTDASAPSLPLAVFTEAGRTVSDSSDPVSPGARDAARNVRRGRSAASPVLIWAAGLDEPRLLAPASSERVFFVAGSSQLYSATATGARPLDVKLPAGERVLALAASPDFERTHQVFVASNGMETRTPDLRVRRYTVDQGQPGHEGIVWRLTTSNPRASALMAFSPDGTLYFVVPEPRRSRIYRLNEDATTTLFAYGPPNASAVAWNPRTSELWCAGRDDGQAQVLVFPPFTAKTAASLPISGHAPGSDEGRPRGQAARVLSLAFVTTPNASDLELLAVVDQRGGQVVRIAIGGNGAMRIAGRYPSRPDARVMEVASAGANTFIVMTKPGQRRSGEIGVVSRPR